MGPARATYAAPGPGDSGTDRARVSGRGWQCHLPRRARQSGRVDPRSTALSAAATVVLPTPTSPSATAVRPGRHAQFAAECDQALESSGRSRRVFEVPRGPAGEVQRPTTGSPSTPASTTSARSPVLGRPPPRSLAGHGRLAGPLA